MGCHIVLYQVGVTPKLLDGARAHVVACMVDDDVLGQDVLEIRGKHLANTTCLLMQVFFKSVESCSKL